MTRSLRPSRTALWIALLGLLLGWLMVVAGPAAPAAAHANLSSSSPANGVILSSPPSEVVLTFSEPVRLVPDRILVVNPDGDRVDQRAPRVEGAVVTVPLDDASARGTYLVSYRVISADSHPIGGGLTFSVGAPSETPTLPTDDQLDDPVVAAAMSVSKYVSYVGLVLLIGSAVMLANFWPSRLSRRGVGRVLWAGLGLVALGTLAALWVQAPYTTGTGLFSVSGDALLDVLGSTYGTAHTVRLGVLVAVAILLRPLLVGGASRTDLILLGVLGVVGLGTWPASGHPIASPLPGISIAVGTVHLAAVAFWVGGLVVLAAFLLRQADERELGAILPTWSRWAALAVTWLVIAGVVMALIEIGSLTALVTTSYGQLFLGKVGLVAVVVAIAAYSRHLVRKHLAPTRPATMRMAVVLEAVVLAVVIGISSVLVQTTPARTAVAGAESAAYADLFTTATSPLYSLNVHVSPAQLGSNTVHVYAYAPETGEPLRVEEWGATAALPAAGVEPIDVPLLDVTDNHAFGSLSLPVAGEWQLRFTLRISEIDRATVAVQVPVG